jgi:hypothetical protein
MEHAFSGVSDDGWGIPTELIDEVKEELRYRKMMEYEAALREQALAAELGNVRFCLEYGEQDLMVHPVFYHYWGRRLGYECWQDAEFVREFQRDNEICRVKNVSRKTPILGHVGSGMRRYFDKAKRRAAAQEKPIFDGKGNVVAVVKPEMKRAGIKPARTGVAA